MLTCVHACGNRSTSATVTYDWRETSVGRQGRWEADVRPPVVHRQVLGWVFALPAGYGKNEVALRESKRGATGSRRLAPRGRRRAGAAAGGAHRFGRGFRVRLEVARWRRGHFERRHVGRGLRVRPRAGWRYEQENEDRQRCQLSALSFQRLDDSR